MNREETLALYEQGVEAWNKWANEMLEERKRLEEAGEWVDEYDEFMNHPKSKRTREWDKKTIADFSNKQNPHTFNENANFSNFIFPGKIVFDNATFNKEISFASTQFKEGASFFATKFKEKAYFDNAIFEGIANFNSIIFMDRARFNFVTFNEKTWFESAAFENEAWFENTIFKKEVRFNNAKFKENTWFLNNNFVGVVYFQQSNFYKKAIFKYSKFFKDVFFDGAKFLQNLFVENATFEGKTSFNFSEYSDKASFQNTNFKADINFSNTKFTSGANFSETIFKSKPDFRSIKADELLDFSSADFFIPPDFSGTDNSIPISLDNVVIRIPSLIASLFRKIDPSLATRFRRYKSFAISDNDNFSEHNFFVGELVGTILQQYGKFHLITFLGCLYELFSNFGRSIFRPIMWWALFIAVFSLCYLWDQSPKSQTQLAIEKIKIKLNKTADIDQDTCDPINSAVFLSFRNGLFFLGNDTLKNSIYLNSYSCLYGIDKNNETPTIPNSIFWKEILHKLFSAILIFLTLLGIRNNFKLK